MNNWVNLPGSWELQAVGNWVDLVSHGERPQIMMVQLGRWSGSLDVLVGKPNSVTNGEGCGQATPSACLPLVGTFGFVQLGYEEDVNLLELYKQVTSCRCV